MKAVPVTLFLCIQASSYEALSKAFQIASDKRKHPVYVDVSLTSHLFPLKNANGQFEMVHPIPANLT